MSRNIIKYGGLALVMIGIVLVIKNLFASDATWQEQKNDSKKNHDDRYQVSVRLLDSENNQDIEGAKLVLKNEAGDIVAEWTTEGSAHLVSNLANGKYMLSQESTNALYFLNHDGVSFEVKGKDQNIVMYNIALTEEEIQNGVDPMGGNSTVNPSEVGVENTSSLKRPYCMFLAIISIVLGIGCFYRLRKDM